MARNKVIAGDYKGKEVTTSFGIPMIKGILGPAIDSSTVAAYEVRDSTKVQQGGVSGFMFRGFLFAENNTTTVGTYQIALAFKNGKKCLIEVNDKLYDAIQRKLYAIGLPDVSASAPATPSTTTTEKKKGWIERAAEAQEAEKQKYVQAKNKVVAGDHQGKVIEMQSGKPFIEGAGLITSLYLSSDKVISYEVKDTTNTGMYVVEVTFKKGEKSIIEVDEDMYRTIGYNCPGLKIGNLPFSISQQPQNETDLRPLNNEGTLVALLQDQLKTKDQQILDLMTQNRELTAELMALKSN